MFSNLSERFTRTLQQLRGHGVLTEGNIQDALREVRTALLEADVALPVIKEFIEKVRSRAVGQEVMTSLNPGQAVIKIVNDQLIELLGTAATPLNLNAQPPVVILMAGLQGSGKTTSAAKLARFLKERDNKKVLLVSTDVYRPAAIEQLATLSKEVGAEFFPSDTTQQPVAIATAALQFAKTQFQDVIIVDTAGRLHIDAAMMKEISQIHAAVSPTETLFVVDSMTGQDAANTAKVFNDALPLTGVIITKTDGDARGGAALSIRQITGKPIKFMGVGEKTANLEQFHPDRVASRILGMGDILSLVEQVAENTDRKKSEALAKKLRTGKDFDLADYRDQIQQMGQMGGITSMMTKIPGLTSLPKAAMEQVNDKKMNLDVAIVNSMTPKERRHPHLINGSRKVRIAKGSGTAVQDVNRLLKKFLQMQKMMKKLAKPGAMKNMMRQFQHLMPKG